MIQRPSIAEQQVLFDCMRDDINAELRETGFEEFAMEHGLAPEAGRLVVARSFLYRESAADFDQGLTPFSPRWATQYEVGSMAERETGHTYRGLVISEALHNGVHEVTVPGDQLDAVQMAVVFSSIRRLVNARSSVGLSPSLTKSLKKIDSTGD